MDYSPQSLETQRQSRWTADKRFEALHKRKPNQDTYYALAMLPYPSGELHMGHVRNYTLSDVIARYHWQKGFAVFHPMGWDAFGLPAENAAIKHGLPPYQWTLENIDRMRSQLKRLGFALDWSAELATCEPSYYRWEQWLFLKLLERGLAYKQESWVNWDPVDQTVLANEQVVDGCGWRSGAPVEQKKIAQWFFKITDYADQLLNDLDQLDAWPEQVRDMQRNWIGHSQGSTIHFSVDNYKNPLSVYTTRPDTLMGVSFIGIAADHPLAIQAADKNPELKTFCDACRNNSVAERDQATMNKEGKNTGYTAIHPLTQKTIPIWITNYVLMSYGEGAVMGVPAHDERDHAFALRYALPIPPVILPSDDSKWDYTEAAYTGSGSLINSGDFNGLNIEAAKESISKALLDLGCAELTTQYRLRDWGISRQRYWGTPIPIIYCDDCGAVPVPESDLPVVLPTDIVPTGEGSPLTSHEEFLAAACPKCQKPARRETDTMDTFVESSWYYARYCCAQYQDGMLNDDAKEWTPVNQYVGGVEHAVMHLLYARFFHKVLRDLGLLNSDEPFTQLLTQGMVCKDGAKMSKSKGNVVTPIPLIEKYGADTVRFFIIFAGPPQQDMLWSDAGVDGAHRFLKRLWSLGHALAELKISSIDSNIDHDNLDANSKQLRHEAHSIIAQAKTDMDKQQFNTVASAGMKLLNQLSKNDSYANLNLAVVRESMQGLLSLLSPITPHICEELWELLQLPGDILTTAWLEPDPKAMQQDSLEYAIQINGKLRARMQQPVDANKEILEKAALDHPDVERYLADKTIRRVIVVPKRLVNIVVS